MGLTYPNKKLQVQEKLLVFFAMAGQSYVVFNWFLRSLHGINPYVDGVFAISAGLALDWGVMQSATGNVKRGDQWWKGWAFWTPLIGLVSSCLIAYDSYATGWWDTGAAIHMVFPLFVWAASQYVAANRHQSIDVWVNEQAREFIASLTAQVETLKQSYAEIERALTAALGYQKELMVQVHEWKTKYDEAATKLTAALDAGQLHQLALMQQANDHQQQLKALMTEKENVIRELQARLTDKQPVSNGHGNGTSKAAIRALLTDQPDMSSADVIAHLGIEKASWSSARTQVSQIKAELRERAVGV